MKKNIALQTEKIRKAQLIEKKEKLHLNKLICSKISQIMHKELLKVKFTERVWNNSKNEEIQSETVKTAKNSRKKKNTKIRLKANSSSNLKEELLDYMVTTSKKLKQGK